MIQYLVFILLVLFAYFGLFEKFYNQTDFKGEIPIDPYRILFQFSMIAYLLVIQMLFLTGKKQYRYLKKWIRWMYKKIRLFPGTIYGVAGIATLFILFSGSFFIGDHDYVGVDPKGLLFNFLFFMTGAYFEEFIFRGFLYRKLLNKYAKRPWIPLLVQGLIFGYLHITNPHMHFLRFINIFLAGIFLGAIVRKSFLYAVLFHFIWNFVQGYVLGLQVSGFTFDQSVFISYDNTTWEDSYTALALLLPLATYSFYNVWKKKRI